ncbi:MAG: glycosyltransferase family 1 protein [Patescibacteria group bacterium]|nr:glycosyltransferase family 1 protein [Patescibacteria group bacterium]
MNVAIVSAPPARLLVDKLAWLTGGFTDLGHDVRRFHHFSELQAADKWADLVLFDQYGAGLPVRNIADAAESRTAVWAQCWRDLICTASSRAVQWQETYLGYGRVMRAMDIVFVKERHRLEEYRTARVNAVYLDCQGCTEGAPRFETHDSPEFDVLVLGNADRAYADRRADAAALVKGGYRVLWAGLTNTAPPHGCHTHRWVHPIKELPSLANRCAVALNVELRYEPGYCSDRPWLLAACGIPVLVRVPGCAYEAADVPAVDIASWVYANTAELIERVGDAIASPRQRHVRGMCRRIGALARHTYRRRAEALLNQVETLTCRS